MKITIEWLQNRGACPSGTEWFLSQKETNAEKVIRKLITQEKFDWANWTITRLMSREQVAMYAIYAAKASLKSFEALYPEDKRPRQAIEAALDYVKNPTPETQSAAESAAWYAAESAASATRSAAWSAASAAESAASAARSAAWSAASAASAAESAASAAASAAESAASAAWSAAASAASAVPAAWSAALKKILLYGLKLLVTKGGR